MHAKLFELEILNDGCEPVDMIVRDEHTNSCRLHFIKSQSTIHYLDQTCLGSFIKRNEYQLLKIFRSKRPETFYRGFKLDFVIIPDFYFVKNDDFKNYIVVNRTEKEIKVSITPEPLKRIPEIYSDGSYNNIENNTGFAYIIRYPDGEEKLFQKKINSKGNNLAELSAVANALEKLSVADKLRIYTDSRYVIKGLAQWVHYWKINDWKTVNNEDVKHKALWDKCENLTRDKYIEFKWIKGHSNHFENSMCDMMAKEAASRQKSL